MLTTATQERTKLEALEREVRKSDPEAKPTPQLVERPVLGGPVAPVWQRAAAWWLDLGATAVTAGAILLALWVFAQEEIAAWLGQPPQLLGLALAVVGVVYALYALGELFWDTSPGKRALGLGLRSVEGGRVPWPRGLGRAAVKSLGPLLYAAGHLFAWPRVADLGLAVIVLLAFGGILALGPEGAALHDRVFRTRVRLTHVLVRI